VPARVSPTKRIRAEIDQLFTADQNLGETLEEVARLGARLLLQTALEAEVTAFLGRDRYARGERIRPGHRNGNAPVTVKTTAGPVTLERPKLRGTDEAFASRLLGKQVTRTSALESLVIAGFVRGLSVRDVEASLAEALGPEAALSKSTVSRICQQIKDEFQAWTTRSLADVALEYLFLDGSHFKMHPGARAEPVLVAWGITTDGKPVLVGLAPGSSESHDAWAGFLAGLVDRGLRAPLLVVSDGAQGLIGAAEQVFDRTACGSAASSIAPATCSPRSPPTPRMTSRPPTGRSSTTSTHRPASRRWPRPGAERRRSPAATSAPTRRRWPACWIPCRSSPATCVSQPSTGRGSATPT
jgi:putative transposase